jgi:hypothetical protein
MDDKHKEIHEQNALLDYIRDSYPDSLLADGFDRAIMGVSSGCDSGRVVYSIQKMLDILFHDSGIPYDEGMEFLEFNTLCAYVGELTPIYLDDVEYCPYPADQAQQDSNI